jgi:tripartite-type tricarboxylate transporter receptor subunit TctC
MCCQTSRPWATSCRATRERAGRGVGAPRSTPAAVIEKLNREINAVLADPNMKAQIVDFGYTVFASSPADFGTFIAAYTEKWAKVIKFSGAKIY